MILAALAQVALGCLWAAIYGTESALFDWPWFIAWAVGLSLLGFVACRWAARGQSIGRRIALGLVGSTSYVVTAVGAFGADKAPLSLVVMAAASIAMLLPSWLGCVMAASTTQVSRQ